MENTYSTLITLAEAVKDLPNPSFYFCNPREMILRCSYDWSTIFTHLQLLEKENFVEIKQAETIQFAITIAGLHKANALLIEDSEIFHSLKDPL
jgi:hypothetical protein